MLMKASINLDVPVRVTKLKMFKVCTTRLFNTRRKHQKKITKVDD